MGSIAIVQSLKNCFSQPPASFLKGMVLLIECGDCKIDRQRPFSSSSGKQAAVGFLAS